MRVCLLFPSSFLFFVQPRSGAEDGTGRWPLQDDCGRFESRNDFWGITKHGQILRCWREIKMCIFISFSFPHHQLSSGELGREKNSQFPCSQPVIKFVCHRVGWHSNNWTIRLATVSLKYTRGPDQTVMQNTGKNLKWMRENEMPTATRLSSLRINYHLDWLHS